MKLNRENLNGDISQEVLRPLPHQFTLPEKVIQFGTGVLLRGLPDYFIDLANRNKIFNGRVIVVKSTTAGDVEDFILQDNLYTVCVRGIMNGKEIEENVVNAAISRVLNASSQWQEILLAAHQPELQVVLSNTTEKGIIRVEEIVTGCIPGSFPGKLLAFLYERYLYFNGEPERGMVIVPAELISDNGQQLKSILIDLAAYNQLGELFIDWLKRANRFCNSLVDRIIPGKPSSLVLAELSERLGYKDELLLMSEAYALWAIEGDDYVRNILSFAAIDQRVKITESIIGFKELKLRLLNGTHTLCCGPALLAGLSTVKAAMENQDFESYISRLMKDEILPSIPYAVNHQEASDFADAVLERFRNNLLDHRWLSIAVQYTAKMRMRVIPCMVRYYELHGKVPLLMARGFAGYLRFMCVTAEKNGSFFGKINGVSYTIDDEAAALYFDLWHTYPVDLVVKNIMANTNLWGVSLLGLKGFERQVTEYLNEFFLSESNHPAAISK